MYQPLVRGLLASAFILTFAVFISVPSAAYAALSQDQAVAVAGLLRSFGADESMITSIQGQVLGVAVPDDYTNVTGDQYPAYCPTLSSTLQLGSRGAQVTEFQHFLSGRYNIAPSEIMTGYFGTITRGYAQEFQREQGLPSFGTVGPLTRAAIKAECGGASAPTGGTTPTTSAVPILTITPGVQPANSLAPQGVLNLAFTRFTVSNPSANPVNFAGGFTAEITGAPNAVLKSVRLLDGAGNPITSSSGTFANATHNWVGLNLNTSFAPGETKTFTVAADTADNLSAYAGSFVKLTILGFNSTTGVVGPFPIVGAMHTLNTTLTACPDPQHIYGYQCPGSTTIPATGPITITNSPSVPGQSIGVNLPNQPLGGFTTNVTGEPISVAEMGFSVSGSLLDLLTNVTLVDQAGSVVAGPVNGSLINGIQFIIFTDSVTFPLGQRTFTLRGKVPTTAPNAATLTLSAKTGMWLNPKGTVTGNPLSLSSVAPFTMNTMTIAGSSSTSGALAVSMDASSPGYKIVGVGPYGASGVKAISFKFRPTGESVNLNKIGLKLTSGSPGSVSLVKLYRGYDQYSEALTQPVGTVVFAGNNTGIATLNANTTLNKDTDSIFTALVDFNGIGTGSAGVSGDLVKIDIDPLTTYAAGLTSGSALFANGSTSAAGVRIFKSYPTVALDTLPSTGLTDGRLLRFKVTANSQGPVGLGKFVFTWASTNTSAPNALDLYAYTDSNYSSPVGTGPHVGGTSQVTGTLVIGPTYPIEVPAGSTYYFELRGNVNALSAGATFTTTLLGDANFASLQSGIVLREKSTNFVWSPNSTTTAMFSDNDWTSGYGVVGLPPGGISQTRTGSGTGTVPPVATLAISPSTIAQGGSATLSWVTSGVSGCQTSTFSFGGQTSGSTSVSPSTTTTYSITCTSLSGGNITAVATLTVTPQSTAAPTCSLSFSPSTTLPYPQGTATFTWSSTNATAGNINWPGSAGPMSVGANGSLNSAFLPQNTTTYTGAFTGPGGTATCTATLNVTNVAPSVPIVTVPNKTYPNTVYSMYFNSTDPNGDTVRYGIDDGINDVHWWSPSPGYTTGGVAYAASGWIWATTGSRTYKVLSEDSKGARSAWGSFTVNVINPPTGGGGGGIQP